MRDDALGLFWEERPKLKKRKDSGPREWGPAPSVPDTGWKTPTDWPNLSAAKIIGFDVETYDPELTEAGPGWGRGKGHIVGASLGVEDGTSWYFPMRHEMSPEQNIDPDHVLGFLKYALRDASVPKVGANIIYDVGWLQWEGVEVAGSLYDVQFAEALLDSETPDVSLDSLAEKYLGVGKTSELLYEWLAAWNGKKINERQRKWIYKTPPSLSGPYAESDAALPIGILSKQWPLLHQRGVSDIFDIECRLVRLLVAMRMKGAPVNLDKAEQTYEALGDELVSLEDQLKNLVGQPVNPNAMESMKRAFDKIGLKYPTKPDKKTKQDKISFAAPVLENINHDLPRLILEHRQIAKVRNTFVKSYILDKHINGRIHCSFHPLKTDGHGTRSGRFASSDPNLQNIPVRSDLGKKVREMFDATVFHADGRWRSYDYSSIEYRLLAHHAVGEGSDEVRAIFQRAPDSDYHRIVGDMIIYFTGIELERTDIKRINFGIIYGMALNALAFTLGLSRSAAKELLDNYHKAIPYARATMDMCANEVHRYGYVETILGRKSDFPYWGPKKYSQNREQRTYVSARNKWGVYNIERQNTHKALNRKLQGGAADIMKKAMVDAYEAGLFKDNACGIPILTVHDELDFEDLGDPDAKCWDELKLIMENPIKLKVPLLVAGDIGNTWADAH